MPVSKSQTRDIVIVGAGHAGAELARMLRVKGFSGSILLVSDEPEFPYERPPLSKACLLGQADDAKILLRPPEFWATAKIEIALNVGVTTLDPHAKVVDLADGRSFSFTWCVLATGGRLRRLTCPGADLPGVHGLRNLSDMRKLRADLAKATQLTVIGGGYIGLEVAAAARELGKEVTLVEAQPRVLARVTSPIVSEFYEKLHRTHGVTLKLGHSVSAIEGNGRVESVKMDDGTRFQSDLVVFGIGTDAEVGLAAAAGLKCNNGVVVDASFRTSAPNILAIGDCTFHPNLYADGYWRLESVQHAQSSAACATDTILGKPSSYCEIPTFWSAQYDIRLQSAGINKDADDLVIRGDQQQGSFCVIYLKNGRIISIDAVNAQRDFLAARKLIELGAHPDHSSLSDTTVPLRTLVQT